MMSTSSNNGKGRSRTAVILGSLALAAVVVASTLFAFTHFNQGSQAQTAPKHITQAIATKAPTLTPTTNAYTGSGFRFTAAGDYGQTSYTTANLKYIAQAGVNFHLGLGDFTYDPKGSADAWSNYAKSHLPANFPFEIVAGGHDSQIDTFAVDLPNRMSNMSGIYAKEYTFDYPVTAPLARFIIVSPSEILPGYEYGKGSKHYNWVSNQIDSARTAHIRWVIVAMHQFCFVIDSTSCANQDLLDLLLAKKVDLILQAQKHSYQASKQLALSASCPTLPITSYNAACVTNGSKSFTKGSGSVIVVSGTGGTTPLLSFTASDPKVKYFRNWMFSNVNQSFGVSEFTVTAKEITERFVNVTGGFSDSFTIHS